MIEFNIGNNIKVVEKEDELFDLLLTSGKETLPLSKITTLGNDTTIKAKVGGIVYFQMNKVDYGQKYGRRQGILDDFTKVNDTVDGKDRYDLVILNDGTYKIGNLQSWDYQNNAKLGFTCASVLINEGKDVDLVTTDFETVYPNHNSKVGAYNIFGKSVKGNYFMVCVNDTSPFEARKQLRKVYTSGIDFLVVCDGGGSTEMIVDGKIVFRPDGDSRSVSSALIFYVDNTIKPTTEYQDGMQRVVMPAKEGTLNQGVNGVTSHEPYVPALDWSNNDVSYGRIYAPFDCECVGFNLNNDNNELIFQSRNEFDDKVIFPDGTIGKATFACIHDDFVPSDIVGKTFKQLEYIANEGVAGYVIGEHSHFEGAKGHTTHRGSINGSISFVLDNAVYPDKFYHMLKGFNDDLVDLIDGGNRGIKNNWVWIDSPVYKKEVEPTPEPEPTPCECEELKKQLEELKVNYQNLSTINNDLIEQKQHLQNQLNNSNAKNFELELAINDTLNALTIVKKQLEDAQEELSKIGSNWKQ